MCNVKTGDIDDRKFRERIGFALEYTRRMLVQRVIEKEMESGKDRFEANHGWIMGAIKHAGDEVYQKDLEKKMHMSRSTMTGILQGFEKAGYIKRVPVNHDARLKKIVLTESGEKFCSDSVDNIRVVEERATVNISEEEKEAFFRTLRKICINLDDESHPGEENL